MITLEEILRTHFDCRKPFLKTPRKRPGYTEHFTRRGGKAYDNLVILLGDLASLGALTQKAADAAVDELERIINEP